VDASAWQGEALPAPLVQVSLLGGTRQVNLRDFKVSVNAHLSCRTVYGVSIRIVFLSLPLLLDAPLRRGS
jgi:hypothetical protein